MGVVSHHSFDFFLDGVSSFPDEDSDESDSDDEPLVSESEDEVPDDDPPDDDELESCSSSSDPLSSDLGDLDVLKTIDTVNDEYT